MCLIDHAAARLSSRIQAVMMVKARSGLRMLAAPEERILGLGAEIEKRRLRIYMHMDSSVSEWAAQ